MKILNSNIQWAGRTYRQASPDGGDPAGGGDPAAGGGDPDGGGDPAGDGGDPAGGDGGDPAGDPDGGGDDWRARYTAHQGEGEDYSKLLGRFTDEGSFVKSAVQAHEKLRAGEVSSGLPEDPSDEQLANYREANGIPIDGVYDFSGAGRELSEIDLEMMGPVAEIAHKHNLSNEALTELMSGYMAETDKVVAQMHTQDNLDAQEFVRTAKDAWGPDYEINMNRATNQLNMLPESVRDQVKQARMPDGRGVMNSPEFMQWLVGVDRQVTPLDPMRGGTESTLGDARSIIAKSKERMRDDSTAWHKDKDAQKAFMQAQEFVDKYEGSQ